MGVGLEKVVKRGLLQEFYKNYCKVGVIRYRVRYRYRDISRTFVKLL